MEDKQKQLLTAEEVAGEEWAAWYALSAIERLEETSKMWQYYLSTGGSIDPEPDTQSPFYFSDETSASPIDGRTGLRVIRSGGI